MSSFPTIDTSETIAAQVVENRRKKRIRVPDNIIAATAQVHNLVLVTRNVSDFTSVQVKIVNPLD
ncbi:PIN domain-containing protein [Desulfurispirillum indicum]|uniref:PIN domain-containing protein n=1 Tax=Desulfurispirillum indicum TaxID=936456 RepID=UPI0031B5A53B